MSHIEFRDLKKQYLHNRTNIDRAIREVLEKGTFIGGSPVAELEKELASYVGVKHCITCANGTDALQLALMAWGVGKGDAVFVPDFTFFSTAEVVVAVGAMPIFVKVRHDTFNIDVLDLERAINRIKDEGVLEAKVIIGVDLFGQPAEYEKLRQIADKYKLFLLEDGAQGFGGQIQEKKACSFGDISTTSFFPAKPLGCYGDGGAIFTDNDDWSDKLRSLKVHGKGIDKYDNICVGMNSRLDTIQAAILLEKFFVFRDEEIEKCNIIAELYTEILNGIVKTPVLLEGMISSWAQYTIRLEDKKERDLLLNQLKNKGIPAMVYYVKPLHAQEAFEQLKVKEYADSDTQDLCDTVLSLPMHPYLEKEEVIEITDTIKNILINIR